MALFVLFLTGQIALHALYSILLFFWHFAVSKVGVVQLNSVFTRRIVAFNVIQAGTLGSIGVWAIRVRNRNTERADILASFNVTSTVINLILIYGFVQYAVRFHSLQLSLAPAHAASSRTSSSTTTSISSTGSSRPGLPASRDAVDRRPLLATPGSPTYGGGGGGGGVLVRSSRCSALCRACRMRFVRSSAMTVFQVIRQFSRVAAVCAVCLLYCCALMGMNAGWLYSKHRYMGRPGSTEEEAFVYTNPLYMLWLFRAFEVAPVLAITLSLVQLVLPTEAELAGSGRSMAAPASVAAAAAAGRGTRDGGPPSAAAAATTAAATASAASRQRARYGSAAFAAVTLAAGGTAGSDLGVVLPVGTDGKDSDEALLDAVGAMNRDGTVQVMPGVAGGWADSMLRLARPSDPWNEDYLPAESTSLLNSGAHGSGPARPLTWSVHSASDASGAATRATDGRSRWSQGTTASRTRWSSSGGESRELELAHESV